MNIWHTDIRQAFKENADIIVYNDEERNELFSPGLFQAFEGAQMKRLWHILPESMLTRFVIARFRKVFEPDAFAVRTYDFLDPYDKSTMIIWSYECVRDHLSDIATISSPILPDVIVLDHVQCVYVHEMLPLLTDILLRLPKHIPVICVLSIDHPAESLQGYVSRGRAKNCLISQSHPVPEKVFPMFWGDPNTAPIPLIDRKRIAPKVKRYLKEHGKELKKKEGKAVIDAIRSMRKENNTPAVIVSGSPMECDRILQRAPQVAQKKSAADILKEIHDFMEDDFNHERVKLGISKKMGLLDPEQPAAMNELFESLFSTEEIDVLLMTLNGLAYMNSHVKTFVLHTSMRWEGRALGNSPMTLMDRYHLERLMDPPSAKQTSRVWVLSSPKMDFVYLKNLYVLPPVHERRIPKIGFPLLLGILSTQCSDPFDVICHIFGINDRENEKEEKLREVLEGIEEELPYRRCFSGLSAIRLKDRMLGLTQEIDGIGKHLKKIRNQRHRAGLRRKETRLQAELDLIPCHSCDHEDVCHRRGHRKLRDFFNAYYDLKSNFSESHLYIERHTKDLMACLEELGDVDAENRLTDGGKISLLWSLPVPMFLTRCIEDGVFNLHQDTRLNVSLMGALLDVKHEGPIIDHEDFVFSELSEALDLLDRSVTPVRMTLMRAGVSSMKPVALNAMILMSWQMGMELDYILKRVDISEGEFMRLFYKSNYFFNRVKESISPEGRF